MVYCVHLDISTRGRFLSLPLCNAGRGAYDMHPHKKIYNEIRLRIWLSPHKQGVKTDILSLPQLISSWVFVACVVCKITRCLKNPLLPGNKGKCYAVALPLKFPCFANFPQCYHKTVFGDLYVLMALIKLSAQLNGRTCVFWTCFLNRSKSLINLKHQPENTVFVRIINYFTGNTQ